MTSVLTPLTPLEVEQRLMRRRAVLVDIREPDEFARRHVRGALSRPLSTLQVTALKTKPDEDIIFTCRTGMRTGANCDQLATAVPGPAFVLEGGLDAWVAAGLPVDEDRKAPLEIMRQVQIAAGSLVLIGVVLGALAHPAFYALSALTGAGLAFAGITGFCGMARLLTAMPWNRRASA